MPAERKEKKKLFREHSEQQFAGNFAQRSCQNAVWGTVGLDLGGFGTSFGTLLHSSGPLLAGFWALVAAF